MGGVGVAGHDERVVDAHARGVQELRHGVDLVDDGHLVGGAGEGPAQSKSCKLQKKQKKPTTFKLQVVPAYIAAASIMRQNRTRILLQNPQPCIYGRGRPDLNEDFAVGRLWRLGLVLRRKEIGHSDVMRHHRVSFVGAHHCDDGKRHSQVVS